MLTSALASAGSLPLTHNAEHSPTTNYLRYSLSAIPRRRRKRHAHARYFSRTSIVSMYIQSCVHTCIHTGVRIIDEHRVGDYPTRSDEHGVWGWDPFFLGTLNSIVREHGTANESYSHNKYFQLMPQSHLLLPEKRTTGRR